MNKPLYLFVGESASGKTSVAEYLEKEKGMKSVQSYTTRPPRYEGEKGHRFISEEEFDKLKNIVAYTVFDGYRYCSTKEQADDADIYVIDPPGVKTFLEKYKTEDRTIRIIFFDADIRTRIDRMHKKGDSDKSIVNRLYNDSKYNWWDETLQIYTNYLMTIKIDIDNVKLGIYLIDANQNFESVIKDVLDIIKI